MPVASALAVEAIPLVDVQSVHPCAGPDDGALLRSGRGAEPGTWTLQTAVDYARLPLRFSAAGQEQTVIGDFATLQLGAWVALSGGWSVGATLPVAFVLRGGGPNLAQLSRLPEAPALGDLRLEGRLALWSDDISGVQVRLAAAVDAALPTASEGTWQGGAGALGGHLLATGIQGPWRGDLNLGARWSPTQELVLHPLDSNGQTMAAGSFVGLRSGSVLLVGAGTGWRLLEDRLGLRGEIAAAIPLIETVAANTAVADLALSADWAFSDWLRVGVLLGGAPTSGPGSAAVRAMATVRVTPSSLPHDSDGDGIDDRDDRCPVQAEDKDGFEDRDGCPDPDDDGDGVLDAADRCPRLAEDLDGFEDADGCPDLDDDGDGIPDGRDLCPRLTEDRDGRDDDDGCPDLDDDGDGIPDKDDLCPQSAENKNGYEDGDGCPDMKPGEGPAPLEPPTGATPTEAAPAEPQSVAPAPLPASPKATDGKAKGGKAKGGKVEGGKVEGGTASGGKAAKGSAAKPAPAEPARDAKPRVKVRSIP